MKIPGGKKPSAGINASGRSSKWLCSMTLVLKVKETCIEFWNALFVEDIEQGALLWAPRTSRLVKEKEGGSVNGGRADQVG